jgi:phosphate transport system substrate-binding protein
VPSRHRFAAHWIAAGLFVAAVLLGSFFFARPGGQGHDTNSATRPPTDPGSMAKGTSPSASAKTGAGTVALPSTHTLNGGGSTFIEPLLEKWGSVYRKEKSVRVNYVATGSGAGIQQFMSGALDFCCSDAPMTDQQMQQARAAGSDVIHVPLALGGIVPAYNLPGIERPLRFSGPVLADIFLGEITKWNDPALREINPGVDLPDREIIVIHRADSSGSTFIFTDFLAKVSKNWQKKFTPSASIKWPVGVGVRGNEAVIEAIGRRPGAIGYVELLYALQSKIKFGTVKNRAGNYVQGSLESVVAAAEGAPADIPADLRFTLTYTPGKDAYPICGCTWAILRVRQPEGKGQRLVDFLRWVTQEGQEYNTDLFYARLPPSLAERAAQRLKEIQIGE